MAYTKTNWVNDSTPLNETNLNKIEDELELLDISKEDKGTILWTNPNPTADFSAQTITLTVDNYDVLEVYYRSDVAGGLSFSSKILKGYGGQMVFNSSGTSTIWVRRINRASDTQFSIEDCKKLPDNTTTNSQCVPLYIIGYKTGLFN